MVAVVWQSSKIEARRGVVCDDRVTILHVAERPIRAPEPKRGRKRGECGKDSASSPDVAIQSRRNK